MSPVSSTLPTRFINILERSMTQKWVHIGKLTKMTGTRPVGTGPTGSSDTRIHGSKIGTVI
eukprot:4936201-Karenia_brevis.AAC.1